MPAWVTLPVLSQSGVSLPEHCPGLQHALQAFLTVKPHSGCGSWREFAAGTAALPSYAGWVFLNQPAQEPNGVASWQLPCNEKHFPTKPPD